MSPPGQDPFDPLSPTEANETDSGTALEEEDTGIKGTPIHVSTGALSDTEIHLLRQDIARYSQFAEPTTLSQLTAALPILLAHIKAMVTQLLERARDEWNRASEDTDHREEYWNYFSNLYLFWAPRTRLEQQTITDALRKVLADSKHHTLFGCFTNVGFEEMAKVVAEEMMKLEVEGMEARLRARLGSFHGLGFLEEEGYVDVILKKVGRRVLGDLEEGEGGVDASADRNLNPYRIISIREAEAFLEIFEKVDFTTLIAAELSK